MLPHCSRMAALRTFGGVPLFFFRLVSAMGKLWLGLKAFRQDYSVKVRKIRKVKRAEFVNKAFVRVSLIQVVINFLRVVIARYGFHP